MLLLLFSWSAVAQDKKKPDATLKMSEGSVAAGIGWTWGKGALTDKGKKYPIELKSTTKDANLKLAGEGLKLSVAQ